MILLLYSDGCSALCFAVLRCAPLFFLYISNKIFQLIYVPVRILKCPLCLSLCFTSTFHFISFLVSFAIQHFCFTGKKKKNNYDCFKNGKLYITSKNISQRIRILYEWKIKIPSTKSFFIYQKITVDNTELTDQIVFLKIQQPVFLSFLCVRPAMLRVSFLFAAASIGLMPTVFISKTVHIFFEHRRGRWSFEISVVTRPNMHSS